MPIPQSELTKAQRPLDVRIAEFLKAHPTEAFSCTEIFAGVEGIDQNSLLLLFAVSSPGNRREREYEIEIEQLVTSGKVRTATVQGIAYYGWVEGA